MHYRRMKSHGDLERTTLIYENHGLRKTPEYQVWADAKSRCYNPNVSNYSGYGARGIIVYEPWRVSFQQFYDDIISEIGARPNNKYSLDRINNNGNYEPGNVRWSTKPEQANNTRRNRQITVGDKTQTMSQWADELGISYSIIEARINKLGWSIREAFGLDPMPFRPSHRGNKGRFLPKTDIINFRTKG